MVVPCQAVIMTITDDQAEYAKSLYRAMIDADIRAELDLRNEKLGLKMREAIMKKIPYMLVIGKKETEANVVTARLRDGSELKGIFIGELINRIKEENNARR